MRCSIEWFHVHTCDMTHPYLQHIAVCIKFTRGGHTPTLCVPPVWMNSVTWLQRVAVCCSVLRCFSHRWAHLHTLCPTCVNKSCHIVAVCCSALQFVAVSSSVLQYLSHKGVQSNTPCPTYVDEPCHIVAVRCSALQCVAVRCSALQCVAVRCSVLQWIEVY